MSALRFHQVRYGRAPHPVGGRGSVRASTYSVPRLRHLRFRLYGLRSLLGLSWPRARAKPLGCQVIGDAMNRLYLFQPGVNGCANRPTTPWQAPRHCSAPIRATMLCDLNSGANRETGISCTVWCCQERPAQRTTFSILVMRVHDPTLSSAQEGDAVQVQNDRFRRMGHSLYSARCPVD